MGDIRSGQHTLARQKKKTKKKFHTYNYMECSQAHSIIIKDEGKELPREKL